ncbi:MAG: YcfL family protein [Nitrospinae bacterium]|nr:YcfL family protein [Nitrospinota bacterium]
MKIRNVALLAGLLFVIGCAGGPGAGSTVTMDTGSGKSQTSEQNFLFSRKIKVGEIKYRKAGDLNQAQVDLISQSSSVVSLEVKGVWHDQNGFLVPDPKELWRLIIINPRETKSITFTAPRQDAVKLQLTAREGNLEGN